MRHVLKRALSVLAGRIPGEAIKPFLGDFCPIFMLHRLRAGPAGGSGQSAAHIERCLAYARRHGFEPLSLPDLAHRLASRQPIPKKSVSFTIDDGFIDHAEIGGPLFARYDIPLTCFVITGLLDGELWPWDDQVVWVLAHTPKRQFAFLMPDGEQRTVDLQHVRAEIAANAIRNRLKELPQDQLYAWLQDFYAAADVEVPAQAPEAFRPMSWADAQRFAAQGHVIAPHTRTHRILSQLPDEQARAEIVDSTARVNEMMQTSARVFCYPTGRLCDFSEREYPHLASAGITGAVCTEARTATPADPLMALPRFALPDNLEDFVQYLSFVEVLKEKLRGG